MGRRVHRVRAGGSPTPRPSRPGGRRRRAARRPPCCSCARRTSACAWATSASAFDRAAADWRSSRVPRRSSSVQLLLGGADDSPLLGDLVVEPLGPQPDQDRAPRRTRSPCAEGNLDDPAAGAGAEHLPAAGDEHPTGVAETGRTRPGARTTRSARVTADQASPCRAGPRAGPASRARPPGAVPGPPGNSRGNRRGCGSNSHA